MPSLKRDLTVGTGLLTTFVRAIDANSLFSLTGADPLVESKSLSGPTHKFGSVTDFFCRGKGVDYMKYQLTLRVCGLRTRCLKPQPRRARDK